jgi:hypothetical protein
MRAIATNNFARLFGVLSRFASLDGWACPPDSGGAEEEMPVERAELTLEGNTAA